MAVPGAKNGFSAIAPRRCMTVLERVLDEEVVLFDPRTNKLHSLNSTAAFIWRRCNGTRTVATLSRLLCRHYAVDPVRAKADVRRLLAELKAEGLII